VAIEAIVKIKRPFEKQAEILSDATRFIVLAIGRQWGKSELALIDCVKRLLDGQFIWYCSPTHKNTKRMWPKFKAALGAIPHCYINNTDYIIRLPNGAFIQFISLHEPDNLRGEGLNHIVVDEAAFVPDGVWDKVLRPMLAARRGSAWFISSPNGKNWFWQFYLRGQDPNETDYASYHAPSASSPVLTIEELESIKRDTPERVFSQEYDANFLEDGGSVFRNLKACIIPQPDYKRRLVVVGIDWARYNDYTVITVIDVNTRQVVEIDRFNEIDWTMQRNRLLALLKRYDVQMAFAESNSIGEPNIEELQKTGLNVQGFVTTNASKAQIINGLALAFEQTDIGIPDNPVLLGELQAYSLERLPSGTFRYSAPSGLHDDCVISLALAWHGLMQPVLRDIAMPDWWTNWGYGNS
jgi:hypothetical protein